ncbi:hypothetical protein OKE68_04460 [Riemerella anatipestifer]|uniref:Integrase catalytic domain-containing protein n=1 Tax=Riemerella anatipestifer TaxID=34085 RepID=A0AAP3EW12_RIEAN|nr:hypothetical protein [Riemerella anatipestifer]AZZ59180.1 hypothetical protein AWB57_09185 [Riemerella anatipestifer]MBT0573758.1 hypothetical protein [Riemerella anatipestifer]MCU7568026.1 hypothetical protein [Riemerella anatipestifer]MCW0490047.1 hypothetical protein [Riemerella anatipestifer]MCW0510680.1 hypothetical protein [Riemerella anatipestifer]
MYDYQKNILSIPAKLLYEDWALISYDYYKMLCRRGKLVRTNEGKGLGNQAWVSFHDLPVVKGVDIKEFCLRTLGKPEDVLVKNLLEGEIVPDPKAIDFYAQHRKPNGKPLNFNQQREKATNAMILNAIETIMKDRVKSNKIFGKKKTQIWQNISDAVNAINTDKWLYNLPSNPRSLQRKYNEYLKDRYMAFIHKGEGSDNARKVNEDIEMLIISLYCLPNKPYMKSTHDMYLQFMGGALEVYDLQTGELYERENFFDEKGKMVEISESTINNYINKPENQIIIAKFRNGDYDYNHKVRPHVHRHAPMFSMSKISLDDRDIMHHKLPDGSKVMAYYAFDDLSGAMIGIAHSKSKNHELFLDCLRNMFQFTASHGLGIPMQMEVEKHLVSDFSEGLMKAGNVFPFVRWCNPTNSQEKYAENRIRAKKYGTEKDRHQNVGRHYARLESNRVTRQKIFDEQNDNYKFAKANYEQIVAWELEEQRLFNNELHHDQERFPGKTRLEVFLENINPNLPKLNKALLSQFIGEHTVTTIRRNQYVTVQYGKYQLPNPQVVTMLAPNNYKVDAYYMPVDGEVTEIYLYQNGEYLCKCEPVPTFNRSNAEWTETDAEKYKQAMDYIRKFDAFEKEIRTKKLSKLGTMQSTNSFIDVECEVVETKEKEEYVHIENHQDQRSRAINDL